MSNKNQSQEFTALTAEAADPHTDAGTIAALGALAAEQHRITQQALDDGLRAIIHEGKVIDLRHLWPHDPARDAFYQTGDLDSFCRFVDQHAELSIRRIFVEDVNAVCWLDFAAHSPTGIEHGHLRHWAGLGLEATPEFRALLQLIPLDGTTRVHDQREFIELLEDYASCITGYNRDGDGETIGTPMPASRIVSLARAIRVVESATTESSVTATGASRSRLDQVDAKSAINEALPERLGFRFRRSPQLGPLTAEIRLRVAPTKSGGVGFAVRGVNLAEVQRAWREDLCVEISRRIEGAQVMVGTYYKQGG